jgi:adenosine kinase
MMDSDKTSINDIKTKISHAMISPNQKEAMIKHLKEAKEKNIKTFFDPGQILPLFSKKELIESSKNASYLIANQNEFEKYQKMTDQDEIELLNDYEKIIVTLGSK